MPHIHAAYQDNEAVFSILDGEVISGSLPRKQTRLVQAWIELLNAHEITYASYSLSLRESNCVKNQANFP